MPEPCSKGTIITLNLTSDYLCNFDCHVFLDANYKTVDVITGDHEMDCQFLKYLNYTAGGGSISCCDNYQVIPYDAAYGDDHYKGGPLDPSLQA